MRFSSNIDRLEPSATMAVSALARRLSAEGRDIIDLSAGEPDFDTPDWIRDAGRRAVDEGHTRYTPAAGLPELREAAAAFMAGSGHPSPTSDEVMVTAGAKQALFNAAFALFGPGDRVAVAAPYWTSYPQIVGLAQAEPVIVRGDEARDFRLTPEDLDGAGGISGLILCSPSNPTGTVYSLDELRALAAWARERGVWVLSDEIYRKIHYEDGGKPAPGFLDLGPEERGPTVVIDGVSKCFAMTGWRIGFAWSDPEVVAKMGAIQSHTTSNPATPSQMAALEAVSNRERADASMAEMREAFQRRRDLVVNGLRNGLPVLTYLEPKGAFYLFLRVDALFRPGEDSTTFCSRLLEEAEVALVPGAAFGDDRFVRLSFAASEDHLREALRRLERALT